MGIGIPAYERISKRVGSRSVVLISLFVVVVSGLVMVGWGFRQEVILRIVPGAAMMKFNTALLFFLLGADLLVYFGEEADKKREILHWLIIFVILLIGLLTLAEYLWDFPYNIETLFVSDPYPGAYPGRMSPATAFCFMLLSAGLWGSYSQQEIIKKGTGYVILVVGIIALVSIVAYVLQIPTESKAFLLDSMAILTSILFLLLAYSISRKNPTLGFIGLLKGTHLGSQLARTILPFIILFPLLLGYLLLSLSHSGWIEIDFGVAVYTTLLILLSALFISVIATRLNATDIKRKALEGSLSTSLQEMMYFKRALDATSIVAITNARGVITYVNDTFCEVSKYDREELVGKTHKVINSGYHPRGFFKELWKTINNGDIWVGEIKNRAKDGSYYWVLTSIVPFRNQQGDIYQHLVIRQDITKLKEAKELLAAQNVNLKLRNKEMEQFAYIASHDLQEPLRTIMNSVDLLEEEYKGKLDATGDRCLDILDRASHRMSDLIAGLLEYARIGQKGEHSRVDCNELIRVIQEDLGVRIEETQTTFELENLPEIVAYETELRLLFQNLITNAIKFAQSGISPHIRIGAQEQEDLFTFSVQDNGIGIADEYKKTIFFIFQRLHAQSTYEGTGIGLAHCQKIVQLNGGDIWVESQPNEGSTFYFTIPKMNL